MSSYAMHRIFSFANRCGVSLAGARVLCLGAAFKARVSDVRNSRALRVMELLTAEGAQVEFCDPLVSTLVLDGTERTAVPIAEADFDAYDLVVVLVRNPAWPTDAVLASSTPTFDAVNALGAPDGATHERL